MSDTPRETAANAGEAVQRRVNQALDAQDEVAKYIRDYPISSVLIALGIGYVLGKII